MNGYVRFNRNISIAGGNLKVYLHIINIYNRLNWRKFDVGSRNDQDQLVPDGQGGYKVFVDPGEWFGRLPVLGLSWEF